MLNKYFKNNKLKGHKPINVPGAHSFSPALILVAKSGQAPSASLGLQFALLWNAGIKVEA